MNKLYPEQTQHEADTANTSNQSEIAKIDVLANQICWYTRKTSTGRGKRREHPSDQSGRVMEAQQRR